MTGRTGPQGPAGKAGSDGKDAVDSTALLRSVIGQVEELTDERQSSPICFPQQVVTDVQPGLVTAVGTTIPMRVTKGTFCLTR